MTDEPATPQPMTDEAADRTSGDGADRSAPAPTVFLHIGTMKTGTSFLQSVLRRNARLLEEDGVLYPLEDGTRWALQVNATRDILEIKGKPTLGGWPAMAEQIRSWSGRAAIVSMEFYSLASATRAQKVVDALAPSKVEVIVTARDLVRVMPSAWQSMIKQGHPWPFAEFAESVTTGAASSDAHRRFWRHHDLVAITRKWIPAVGAENIHLVTVPPSGAPPSLLWERFCSVLGVEPTRYDISQDRKSNFSLSYSDSELMRRINNSVREELGRVAYKRWATRYFANRVLRASSGEKTAHDRPVLTAATHTWAVQRSREMVDGLSGLGMHVVGDLEELIPPAAKRPLAEAYAEPITTYPEQTADILAALLRRIAEVDPQLPAMRAAAGEFQDADEAAAVDESDEVAGYDGPDGLDDDYDEDYDIEATLDDDVDLPPDDVDVDGASQSGASQGGASQGEASQGEASQGEASLSGASQRRAVSAR